MQRNQEKLLQLRKKMNKKRPSFRRVESWRYKRVKDPWRKARGIDSQTRQKTKSGVKSPEPGYRGPIKTRGLHPSGYVDVNVITIKDLEGLDPKKHAVKIARRLGARKRMDLIDVATKKKFKILNVGITQRELEELDEMLDSEIDGIEDLDEDELSLEDLDDLSDED